MLRLQKIGRWWSTVFGLDVRSLAVFRIGLGCILLADVILRWPTVADMYTDDGILPRSMMREVWSAFGGMGLQQWGAGTWSLHAILGNAEWQYALFAASGVFAILLALGAWTRCSTIASYLLIVSVHNRIPFVLTSGDTHLRIVLFWAIFLPMGKVWALDALWLAPAKVKSKARAVASAATAGLVIQIFILYFFSGLAKWNDAWWNGDGIDLAIKLTIYNTSWSQAFLQYPVACHYLSIATVVCEVFLPWLLFVSYKNSVFRWITLITFVGMHAGILFILSIGLFSYVCSVVWLAMIPSSAWDRLLKQRVGCARSEPIDEGSFFSWQNATQIFCGSMIFFMLAWNVINIRQDWIATPLYDPARPTVLLGFDKTKNPIFRAFEMFGHAVGVGQHFQMFGSPPIEDPWFIYRARLRNGTTRDVFLDGREIPTDGPLSGRDSIPHHHWRQIHRNLTDNAAVFVRPRLAVFMAERWNRSHPADEQVEQLRIECYLDQFWPTPIPGEARGAVIWGTYPDGPGNAFDTLLQRAIMGGHNQGF